MNPADELVTVADLLRWCATQLAHADVCYGHGTDNAWDEALALLCGRLGIVPDNPFKAAANAARFVEKEIA